MSRLNSNVYTHLNVSKIDYDVLSQKNILVIKSVEGKALDRNFDSWALF